MFFWNPGNQKKSGQANPSPRQLQEFHHVTHPAELVPVGRKAYYRDMVVLHMTEAELARDVHGVLDKIRDGAEVIVERDAQPVAVIKPVQPVPRTLCDLIRLAEERERERGYAITLDPDFAADVEEIVRNRKPWNPPSWD
jgi:antitoxin (DNA-binding transcriptional repressor) of toxin-antitoxin stability system